MEQLAAPYTPPRRSLARKLATLPPIATGLPERPLTSMNEKQGSPSSSGSPNSCANMLPCIMITPSSPTHESDYEIHYFETPEPGARCGGFFSSIRQAFCPSTYSSAIALPDSPSVSKYGYNASSADRSWSASRRFRMILALAAVLFFALHLVAIPKMHNGVYEVFSTPNHGGAQMMDDAVASWETVSEWQPAPPSSGHYESASTGHPHHDTAGHPHHEIAGHPHNAQPVDVVEPVHHPAL